MQPVPRTYGHPITKASAKLRIAMPEILENAENDLTVWMRNLPELLWDAWQGSLGMSASLPEHDAALQQQSTNLIDHRRPASNPAVAKATAKGTVPTGIVATTLLRVVSITETTPGESPTREYQTDQSSFNTAQPTARFVLALRQRQPQSPRAAE